ETLSRLLLPVGEFDKQAVFAIAREAGLSASSSRESQDLCFAPGGDLSPLFDEADLAPGPIVDLDGKELGQHHGLPRYTIGQRRGLGISAPHPLFVVDLIPESNAVVVGPEEALYASVVYAVDACYPRGVAPIDGAQVEAKLRYRSPAAPAIFQASPEPTLFRLQFRQPQRAVTPGQLAVLYDGDRVLGGGTLVRPPRATDAFV
ncbi:MAG: tRNA methyl transferase PRC-barrel domain-containing protein, partial [Candidatus Bipolaricaulota bacterium]